MERAPILMVGGAAALRSQFAASPSGSGRAFHQVRSFAEAEVQMLRRLGISDEILAIVRHHHERCDGRGYPDGLKREEIPLGARIVALADAYVAMTARRSYRPALDTREALERIEAGLGSQFDPELGKKFLGLNSAA